MIWVAIIFNCNSKWPKREESQRKGSQRRHRKQKISRKHTRRWCNWRCKRPKPTFRLFPNMNNLNMCRNVGRGSGSWDPKKRRRSSS